jgi:hypothetical protein
MVKYNTERFTLARPPVKYKLNPTVVKQSALERHGWKQIRSKTDALEQYTRHSTNILRSTPSYQSQAMKRRRQRQKKSRELAYGRKLGFRSFGNERTLLVSACSYRRRGENFWTQTPPPYYRLLTTPTSRTPPSIYGDMFPRGSGDYITRSTPYYQAPELISPEESHDRIKSTTNEDRHERKRPLSFYLQEETKQPDEEACEEPAVKSAPKVPAGGWVFDALFGARTGLKSDVFNLSGAKKSPRLTDSTSPSRNVAEQGCGVHIRRDVRMRRQGNGKHNRESQDGCSVSRYTRSSTCHSNR